MTSKSEQIMKLIDAGYSKAEIDAIMLDNNVSESTPSGNETVDTSKETVTTNETTTETATTETKSTVNDSISNAVLLTAITNMMYSDYGNTVKGDISMYVKMAKDFFGRCKKRNFLQWPCCGNTFSLYI